MNRVFEIMGWLALGLFLLVGLETLALALPPAVQTHLGGPVVERFSYVPGSKLCGVGDGPDWEELQAITLNLR